MLLNVIFPVQLISIDAQIGNKFRDENARHGLLRSREFLMKDLYTFDTDKETALQTYEEVNEIYRKLFTFLGIPFVKGQCNDSKMNNFVLATFKMEEKKLNRGN